MKKLHRKAERFKGWTLGLDVHKKFIQYSLIDEAGDEVENEQIVADKEGLRGLIQRVRERAREAGGNQGVQASLEACGCFVWVFDEFKALIGEEAVHVAAPSKVRAIAESSEKNDENDAYWLAYLLYERRLPEAFVAQGDLRELRIVWRERQSAVNARSDQMRRLRSHLMQMGEPLAKHALSSQVGRQKIVELLERLVASRGQYEARVQARTRIWGLIQAFDQEVEHWDERIAELAGRFKEIKVLDEEIPGVGVELAAGLWSELGDPRRYKTCKAYAKATGLTPSYRESGGVKSSGGITRCGSSRARFVLTRAVVACMRCTKEGPGLAVKQWVLKLSKRKKKKAAIVAAARKLAEGVWRLFNLGEAFDLARAFGWPRGWEARSAGG